MFSLQTYKIKYIYIFLFNNIFTNIYCIYAYYCIVHTKLGLYV